MKCGRFISSLALASALIGGALAQQAPTPPAAPAAPAPVAKEYDQMATNLEKMSRARLMAER